MVAAKKLKPVEMIGDLEPMLTRLKLTAIRDQLETLLDQAARADTGKLSRMTGSSTTNHPSVTRRC